MKTIKHPPSIISIDTSVCIGVYDAYVYKYTNITNGKWYVGWHLGVFDGSYWHGDVGNKPSYAGMMAKKNDITKNWLAKKEGYTMVRIKEKELVDNYNQVKENISSLINESRK